MNNLEIRDRSRKKGVPHYLIAAELGITPNTFSVWLREELVGEKRKKVLTALDAIVARRNEE